MLSFDRRFAAALPSLFPTLVKRWEAETVAAQGSSQPSQPSQRSPRAGTHTRAHVCVYVCTKSNKGWEGWEGWEEAVRARLSASQPTLEVGKRLGSDDFFKGIDAMNGLVEKMRADFTVLVSALGWSVEDVQVANAAIRAAMTADDPSSRRQWACWLADLSRRVMFEDDGRQPAPQAAAACQDCAHYAAPGRSAGYCAGRDDLKPIYGKNHPLHVLPLDGGVSCARFVSNAAAQKAVEK